MAFKFIVLAALVAAANAGFIGAPLSYAAAPAQYAYAASPAQYAYAAAPVAQAVITKTVDEYDPHPQYSYAYDVQDSLTGDSKSQHESRDGDVVQGSYSLLESDGTRRTVDYTADSVNGFNAVVHKEPAQAAIKTYHAAPVVHAAPAIVKTVAPAQATITKYSTHVDYSAPVAHTVAEYSAPVAHYSAPVAHYSAPIAHYSAPVAQYSAPAYAQVAAPAAAGWA